MKVYADLLFLLNCAMDFLLLCTVGRVLHLRMRPVFLLLSSASGGVFACVSLFVSRPIALILALLFAPILLLIAFGKSVIAEKTLFFRANLLFFGSSFLTGGLCTFLSQTIPRHFSPFVFFLLCGFLFFFTFRYFDLFSLSKTLFPVTVSFDRGGKTETLRLLCDSGCLVREPISALPVLLIAPKRFDALFPEAVFPDAALAASLHLRYVPLRTASGESVVPAVLPKNLTYCKKEKSFPLNAMLGRAQNDGFSGYDGVFPASLY